MKNIVNQIYWERVSDTYMYGTSFQKKANNVVTFKNNLLPSGKILMKWESTTNYQSVREVPSLPMLLNGKRYRIKIDASVSPNNAAIFAIRFFDLQGIEFDKCVFTSLEQSFTYPNRAVRYNVEIINGGCEEIIFRKFQIAPAELDSEVFDHFLVHPIYQGQSEKEAGLILVHDAKRARQVANFKIISDMKESLACGYLAWQNKQQLIFLQEYLLKNQGKKITLFSTDEDWDEILAKGGASFSNCQIVYSKQFLPKQEFCQKKWIRKDYQNIDQVRVVKAVINYYKG